MESDAQLLERFFKVKRRTFTPRVWDSLHSCLGRAVVLLVFLLSTAEQYWNHVAGFHPAAAEKGANSEQRTTTIPNQSSSETTSKYHTNKSSESQLISVVQP